jgi:hypothetical protein
LQAAKGTFVARIDPDDRYRPHFLSCVLEKFERFSEVEVVYGNVALIDESGAITLENTDEVHQGREFKGNEFVALLRRNFICSATVIARRTAWLKSLPVPEGLAFHDWYFTLMMAREHEFYYIDRVLADYRVHQHNHHSRVARDRTEEASVLRLLDRIFSERESDPILERLKQRARRSIYAAQYLDCANKYFGFGMDADARRCYLSAISMAPARMFDVGILRRIAGTCVGRRTYDALKSLIRHVVAPVRSPVD